MRLGGVIFKEYDSPAKWAEVVKSYGYRAAFCPVDEQADEAAVKAYAEAAAKADIVIAECGAWSNPLSRDEAARKQALEKCKGALDLAERIGARCAVNIAGSRGEKWDGPDAADLAADTVAMIVDSVREIIDAVKPKRAAYTLEPMPWMYPDSPDSYLELIKKVERDAFGVHLDPVNIVNSPARYFNNKALLEECFAKLGPHIKSCHAKDIILRDHLTVHLDEVVPGRGKLDYTTYLAEIEKLDRDMPLLIEHFSNEEEYREAANYINKVSADCGLRNAD